jgi:ubiquinone/menaquinone biosynthesis C-methylase UbiE
MLKEVGQMDNSKSIKEMVKEKYGKIAKQSSGENKSSCCGSKPSASNSCCGEAEIDYSIFSDDYSKKEGYVTEADLGLGCGLPTDFAGIKKGDTVVDLGSGAGNDVFVARSLVGETGKVIGIDMTPEMIEKANRNREKLGYKNIEFHLAEIESTPLNENSIDVVVSNCVLNLSPEKEKAFMEVNRILKSGAHFCVSDIVLKGKLPDALRKSAEMYAGCVSGALQEEEYLDIIKNTGFENIEIKKSKSINLPDEILKEYLNENELREFKNDEIGIFSITVVGYKK